MLEVLNLWNRWGSASLNSGHRRDITAQVANFIDSKEVVALVGLRRSGKTTVMYQIMDELKAQGTSDLAMLHMNFEEPAIANKLSTEMLDELYRSYREEVYPEGKAYLFFDEIQNVPAWEKWVRARNETENIKIFITGSSASLMSRELATVLTGRHVEFYVSPFSFKEVLRIKKIAVPEHKLKVNPPPIIQKVLTEYMTWGGFPEVVLSENEERKRIILRQYFDDILFNDVALRHNIRDLTVLRNIAVHLLTQTACLVSVNRIAKLFSISLDMAAKYCNYIRESFLIETLPFFSLKVAERNRNPKKIHVCDLGLRQIANISLSADYGRLAESLVFQHLQQKHSGNIFYWKGKQELDFVIRDGNTIHEVIQVAYEGMDEEKTRYRELSSLQEANGKFPKAKAKIVVSKLPKESNASIEPLWQFLLN